MNNQRLSPARAEQAAEALLAYGLDPARVSAAGYGETRPLTSNDTRSGRALNRRTDLVVTANSRGSSVSDISVLKASHSDDVRIEFLRTRSDPGLKR